ncbi:MAG: fibronectin type III domain-containing protein [Eubacterium sp.]
MKKLTSLFLSLVLMISTFSVSNMFAFAAGTNIRDAEEITFDTEYSGNLISGQEGQQFDFYKFVVPVNSKITISSELYDSQWNYSYYNIYNAEGEIIYDDYGTYNNAIGGWKFNKTYSLSKGTYYFSTSNYHISGCSLNGGGTYYFKIKISPKLSKPLNIKLSNKKRKTLRVSWSKASNITGYQIQYSTDKKFKKAVKSIIENDKNATSKSIKNLKSNKKYYVRMRSYIKIGNKKYYSSWSATTNKTTKK